MRKLCSKHAENVLCLVLCALSAISLRKSGDFLAATVAFLSLHAWRIASKRSRSKPLLGFNASIGRSGESCRMNFGDTMGGGESRVGLYSSSSASLNAGESGVNGENGSTVGSSGDAREMDISGTRTRDRVGDMFVYLKLSDAR